MALLNILMIAFIVFYPSKFFLYKVLIKSFNPFETHVLSDTISLLVLITLVIFTGYFSVDPRFILLAYLVFITIFSIIYLKRKQLINPEFDLSFIFTMLIIQVLVMVYISYFSFYVNLSRTYLPDETSYIYAAQLLKTHTVTLSLRYPIDTYFRKYFGSRAFLVGYLYFIMEITGIEPTELYIVTSLFVAMLVPTVMGLLYDLFSIKDVKYLIPFTIFSVLSPSVHLWGLTVLPDIPESYFILSFSYIFLNSIKIENKFIKINRLRLFTALGYIYIILILLRGNIFFIGVILLLYILYLYKLSKKYHVDRLVSNIFKLFKISIFIICLLLLIDLCYFLYVHVLKDIKMAVRLRPYLLYGTSFVEVLMGWFIPYPWKPKTLLTLTYDEWISRLNFAVSPEVTGLIGAAMPILPLLLIAEKKELKVKILLIGSLFTFWLSFFHMLLLDNFHDFTRYNVSLYILFMIFSVVELCHCLSGLINVYALIIKMVLPLFISYSVTKCCGGTKFFWLMENTIQSFDHLLYEFFLYIGIILFWKICTKILYYDINIQVKITKFKVFYLKSLNKKINLNFMLVIGYLIINYIFGCLFISLTLDNTLIMFSPRGRLVAEIAQEFEKRLNSESDEKFYLISNFHIYLRNHVELSKVIVLPMPTSIDEFRELLSVLTGKVFVAITNDFFLSYYTVINRNLRNILNLPENELFSTYGLKQIYDLQWQQYKYSLYEYVKAEKDEVSKLNLARSKIHASVYWNYSSRTCVVNFNVVSNFSIVLASLKFSRIIMLNSSSYEFPFRDLTTKLDMAYQVCYSSLIVTADSVEHIGFSILRINELVFLFLIAVGYLISGFTILTIKEKRKFNLP